MLKIQLMRQIFKFPVTQIPRHIERSRNVYEETPGNKYSIKIVKDSFLPKASLRETPLRLTVEKDYFKSLISLPKWRDRMYSPKSRYNRCASFL